jgi:hypothetical protein
MDEFIKKLEAMQPKLPHASNLLHKLKKALGEDSFIKHKRIYREITDAYSRVLTNSLDNSKSLDDWVTDQVDLVNSYLRVLNDPSKNLFSHQSDFKSSVIPELVCVIFNQINTREKLALTIQGQGDVVIDVLFSHKDGGKAYPKKKRVDAALLLPYTITTASVIEAELSDFAIPIVSVEVKTNLDKNMISGIQYSVERLKATFPECKYFVLSEYSDFNIKNQNYANSSIDEIFILRNQKRSDVRSNRNPANPISVDLIREFTLLVSQSVLAIKSKKTDISDRLGSGVLIHEK